MPLEIRKGSFSVKQDDIFKNVDVLLGGASKDELKTLSEKVDNATNSVANLDYEMAVNNAQTNGGDITDDMSDCVDGAYVSPSGEVNKNASYCYKYFKYYGGSVVTSGAKNDGVINYLDADKNLISSLRWNTVNWTLAKDKIPYGTAYICVSIMTSDKDSYSVVQTLNGIMSDVSDKYAHESDTLTSRHLAYSTQHTVDGTPLRLMHFSDIHADTAAMHRIMDDSARYAYDDAICTGDIVEDTNGSITSWWYPNVLTCIGNHDTASYTAGTGYNWTYLTMAQRDTMYIAPFEANWGTIVHTSGTSYYYKDYATQKVRLIVIDTMLYSTGADESQATAQTEWLTTAMSNASANGYHVLIAVHAPHGGALPYPSSFGLYGRSTAKSVETDCNLPDSVVMAVADAITNGLHFVGYICGHTHQDDIWDATGDGTQLIYNITCAAVTKPERWSASDQYRDETTDAYNLITIDTDNSLIKIVRCGGANVDNMARMRTAIVIDYSTGKIVSDYGYDNAVKQDVISDLDTIRKGAELGATAVQPSKLTLIETITVSDDTTTYYIRNYSGEYSRMAIYVWFPAGTWTCTRINYQWWYDGNYVGKGYSVQKSSESYNKALKVMCKSDNGIVTIKGGIEAAFIYDDVNTDIVPMCETMCYATGNGITLLKILRSTSGEYLPKGTVFKIYAT